MSTTWKRIKVQLSENIKQTLNATYHDHKDMFYIFIYALFFLSFLLWSSFISFDNLTENYKVMLFPWVVTSFCVNTFGLLFIKRVGLSHLGLWFVVLSYFFMFGHVITFVLDLKSTLEWDPSVYYAESNKLSASIYAVFSLTAFSFVCFLFSKKGQLAQKGADLKEFNSMYITGWTCLGIGVAAGIINSWNIISAALEAGSYQIFTNANTSGFADDLSFLITPGICLLFFCKRTSKKTAFALLFFSIGYFIIFMSLTGGRKTAVFAILAIVLAFFYARLHIKASFKNILISCLFLILFLNLIYIIRDSRTDLSSIIPNYFSSITHLTFIFSLFSETLTETGLTFYSLAGIFQCVPSVFPYEYGMTIVKTIPSALPIGWLVGSFFDTASSTYVINEYIGAPVGASLIGDFYWNWGFAGGVIMSGAFGALVSYIWNCRTKDSLHSAIYFSMFSIMLMGVRSGIFELFRPLLIVVGIPIILYILFKKAPSRFNS